MATKYEHIVTEQTTVSEPVGAYYHVSNPRTARMQVLYETPNSEKKAFLRNALHPSTAVYLDSVDWMEDKPFPSFDDSDDESWIDEAEKTGAADIVGDEVIDIDRTAWHSVR